MKREISVAKVMTMRRRTMRIETKKSSIVSSTDDKTDFHIPILIEYPDGVV